MSIRGFSPNTGIKPKSKINLQCRPNRSSKTHSEKKFTPKINKSFTCYNDSPTNTTPEKIRNISFMNLKFRPKSVLKSRPMRSSIKFNQSPVKKEANLGHVEKAEELIKTKQFDGALEILNKILKENPGLPAALIARGKCLMESNKYNEAIADLLLLTRTCPNYEKNAFLALAICFVAVGDYNLAVQKLSKGLSLYPRFKEALMARAQLLNQQQEWEKGASDFYKVIKLAPGEAFAYIGIADSFIGLNEPLNALKVLKSAQASLGPDSNVMIKKAKILFEMNQLEKSIKLLNKSIKLFPSEAECYYIKALVYIKSENLTEAALCLEQVVKFDADKKFSGAAIFDLGAIRVRQKDYYGAMHTFKRASDMEVEIFEQKMMENYVEAILWLVKRKFKEGAGLLTRIIKKKHPIMHEYIGNCYTYRGYAYAAQEQHEKAVKDLIKAKKIQKLDSASKYNLLISQSILNANKKPEQSLVLLKKARKLYSKNPEPYIYEAALNFSLNREEKSLNLLTIAISLKPEDSDLHFFRGIAKYSMKKFAESIQDIEIAIDKSDENNAFHYFCKALNYACLGMYSKALNDLSAVLQINTSLGKAHYYRGICAFLQGDSNLAFSEFQKLLILQPNDAQAHLQAGNLLLANNHIKDALKAYKNSLTKEKTKAALLQSAKCHLLIGDLKNSQEDLAKVLAIDNNKAILQDFNVLKGLEFFESRNFREAQKIFQGLAKDGLIISRLEILKFNALCYFFIGEYKNALIIFKERLLMRCEDSEDTTFNIALCYALLQQFEQGIRSLNDLAYLVEEKDRAKILMILAYLHQSMNNETDAKDFMQAAFNLDNDLFSDYIESKAAIQIFPLSSNDQFCCKFPSFTLILGDTHIILRPSFSLPSIELPVFEFPTEQIIVEKFSLNALKCKPEASWMNRVQGVIQFTDEIQEALNETESISIFEKQEDEEGELESNVFEENIEKFKKYRSAYCLNIKESENIFKDLQNLIEK